MAIIGELIKRGIELSHNIKSDPDPVTAQKDLLTGLLQKAMDTAFGRAHDFKGIMAKIDLHEAFASYVPYYDYDRIYNEWWKDVYEGKEDITWPGKPGYFALSSGTTSNTKYIPVTDDMLTSIRNAGVRQVLSLAEFDLPSPFFQKEVLMLGSSTNLKEVNGHLEGEISGISAYNLPFWFKGFYRPGPEISAIDDWDERVEKIAAKAPEWDIGGLSGIPSWIELMLKRVMEHNKAGNIHEIWPGLKVYTSGGVAFDPYRKSFEKIFGKPVTIVDTYLASEGYLATQVRPGTDAMALLTNNGIFFEFVPLEPDNIREDGTLEENARALTIDQVEEDKDYIVIISTVAGAWRYMIGDTIKFTDLEKAEIKITGRTKSFLNVVGSQLSEFQMIRAMEELESKNGLDILEFTVSAVKNGEDYGHHWYLGCKEMKPLDEKDVARQLDSILKDNNKNYKVARTKALKRVEVKLVPASHFYDWAEATRKKGGQTKVPKVMKEEQFSEWEEFIGKQG
jgi:hypothetical protein